MADLKLEDIINESSKFDPTTPFGHWDSVAGEYENTTDTLIFNYENMTLSYAWGHSGANASPTPISGDTLARFKDQRSEKPRLKSHRRPTGYAEYLSGSAE